MWQNGNRIHFQTTVAENNSNVISGAYVDLHRVSNPKVTANLCATAKNMESDAVFQQIADHVKTKPDEAKKINGVFHFVVTEKGQPQVEWVLDFKKGVVTKGKPEGKVDTVLTIDDKDMVQMSLGKLNPQMAFMKGKLKVKGNIMLTQKLKSVLEANRPKL